MSSLIDGIVVTADEVYNVVSESGYGDQFAAFDPASGAVYTVYWTESGDLVGETAPTVTDDGQFERDLVSFASTPLPLVVWFPAGVPAGWAETASRIASSE